MSGTIGKRKQLSHMIINVFYDFTFHDERIDIGMFHVQIPPIISIKLQLYFVTLAALGHENFRLKPPQLLNLHFYETLLIHMLAFHKQRLGRHNS